MSTTVAEQSSWLREWAPEDADFWRQSGKKIAWVTLTITTFNLLLAFATWFMVSAIVVRLKGIGFNLDTGQLFWLAAMPGLAGGTLRIIHMFLIPILGSRATITWSTLLLVLPCVGWAWAVQNPQTPYWVLLALSFLAGLGGGNFSSFMPSTSLFFPKRLQGTSLGIQAGVGNFGVSVTQFVVPWIIGFTLFGSLLGEGQTFRRIPTETARNLWVQNGALVWIPFIVLGTILGWMYLRNVPTRATFWQQTDIFKEKHTWFMTSLYIMTFGSFSGFSAAFPLLMRELYGAPRWGETAPDPLTYAFLGPLVGAASRILFGPISDWIGGARVTSLSGIGLLACALAVTMFTQPTSLDQFPAFVLCMLGLFFFSGVGNASTFKQIPMIFPPRQAGGVIGWTAAVAAYGPFVFSGLIGTIIGLTTTADQPGHPTAFFYGAAVFYLANLILNWWFYDRPGAEKPC